MKKEKSKPVEAKPEETLVEENRLKVKKSFTLRPFLLIGTGVAFLLGVVLFAIYVFSANIAVGGPAVLLLIGGGFSFWHFWKRRGDSGAVEHIGEVPKEQMNSLCIYPSEIKFEDVYEPEGYPWECQNDGKKYFVM